jgi:hypothetical protein
MVSLKLHCTVQSRGAPNTTKGVSWLVVNGTVEPGSARYRLSSTAVSCGWQLSLCVPEEGFSSILCRGPGTLGRCCVCIPPPCNSRDLATTTGELLAASYSLPTPASCTTRSRQPSLASLRRYTRGSLHDRLPVAHLPSSQQFFFLLTLPFVLSTAAATP